MLSVDAVLRVVLTVMVPVGVAELETVTVLVDDSDTGLEAVAVGEPELVPVIVPAALEPVAVTVGERLLVRVGDLVMETVAEALGTAAALPVLDTDGVPVTAFDRLLLGVLRAVALPEAEATGGSEPEGEEEGGTPTNAVLLRLVLAVVEVERVGVTPLHRP